MPDLFHRLRRTLERDERALIVAQPPGMQPRTPIPPPPLLVDEPKQVASLRRQLDAANSLVARLQAQVDARPAVPAADRHCPSCAGLERTVQLLRQERGELRGQLAAYRIEATRHQQLHPITNTGQQP